MVLRKKVGQDTLFPRPVFDFTQPSRPLSVAEGKYLYS
ncbi:hypothetical protein Hsw_2091 [Hymenobacter swuensis DY53]|uniref:Uncharacterized protein n=1 Tax=Hymenobacter swuensis DY53 TaxID=1227739 RepID=W8F4Z3_9BACT|nr:hypothetical protein Hsw_2091 [Hymenobacter swuensis DY53]